MQVVYEPHVMGPHSAGRKLNLFILLRRKNYFPEMEGILEVAAKVDRTGWGFGAELM